MPDIVITPNRGSSTNNPKIDFTGITAGTIKLEVLSDGTITWNGASGSLFSITDSLLGSLMSVNDISGLPLLEVFSDNRVIVGQFGARLGIGTVNPSSSAKLHIAGLNTAPPNVFLQTTNSAANGGIFWRNNTNTTTSAIASNYNISDASGNIEFLTGGTTTRMSITSGGLIKMTDTTDVTAADTGALQVKGGIYVAKSALFGSTTINGNLSVTPTWNDAGTNFNALNIVVTETAAGASSNLLRVFGLYGNGMTVNKFGQTTITSNLVINNQNGYLTSLSVSSGKILFQDTTDTTTANTGALQVSGGAYVAKNILSGANITANDFILGTSGPSVKSLLSARASKQGLVFDGSGNNGTFTAVPIGSGNFSVSALVNITSYLATGRIISRGSAWEFGVYSDGRIYIYNNTTLLLSTSLVPIGKACLVSYTKSGSSGTFYLDGISAGTVTDNNTYTSASQIGGNLAANAWLGTIQSLLIYNRALSAAEVVALYESGAPSASDYNTAFYSTDFSSSTGWSFGGGGSGISGGKLNLVNNDYAGAPTSTVLYTGKKYKFTVTVDSITAGNVSYYNGSSYVSFATSAGTYTVDFTASADYTFFVLKSFGGNAVCDTFAFYRTGLLLAPDAAQMGGGLTWYDTSGNGSNISWTSGVQWSVPTSGKIATTLQVNGTGTSSFAGPIKLTYGSELSPTDYGLFASNTNQLVLRSAGQIYLMSSAGTGGNFNLSQSLTTIDTQNLSINNNVSASPSLTIASGGFNILNNGLPEMTGGLQFGIYPNSPYTLWMQGVLSTASALSLSINPLGGNVLIGTGTDSGQKLQVNGTAAISSNLTVSGGLVTLNNATSNLIYYNTNGVAAPTVNTRSAGTKIVLYDGLSASTVDYAIGINAGTFWNSVPGTTQIFSWYGGTATAMWLSGTGNLNVSGDISAGALFKVADGQAIRCANTGPSGSFYLDSPVITWRNPSTSYSTLAQITPTGFSIATTTASVSITTGALTVAGGVGVAGNLYSQSVFTSVLYDLDNTNFYVNPASTSNFNSVKAASFEWGSLVGLFGQPYYKINELTDFLHRADVRFTVTNGNSIYFDGNYDSAVPLSGNSTIVININVANQSGVPAAGITYPEGKIYVSFYYTYNQYTSISLRTKHNGTWITASAPVNVSTAASYKVMEFTIGGNNYLTDIELTIVTGDAGTAPVWLAAINYYMNRWTTEAELPYFSKYLATNRYNGTFALTGIMQANKTASAGTPASYPFQAQVGGVTELAIGSDGSNAIIQSWNSRPLTINSQGNNVTIGGATTTVTGNLVVSGASESLFGNNGNQQLGVRIRNTTDGSNSAAYTVWQSDAGALNFYQTATSSNISGNATRYPAATSLFDSTSTGGFQWNAAAGKAMTLASGGHLGIVGNLTVNGTGDSRIAGNLGVGAGPNYDLDINQAQSAVTLNLKADVAAAVGNYAEIAFQLWTNAGNGANVFGGSGTSRPSVVLRAIDTTGAATGTLIFATFTGGATNVNLTEKMRLTSGGNLFVGTQTDTGGRVVVDKPSQVAASSTASGGIVVSNLAGGNAVLDLGSNATYLSYIQSRNYTNTTYYQLNLNPAGGNVLIGGTTDISGSGGLKVFGTTASTSSTTGALQVAGGVGIVGAVNIGSTLSAKFEFSPSYTGDGVWSANARPSTFSGYNPNSALLIGYADDGGGSYYPSIGFKCSGDAFAATAAIIGSRYRTTAGALDSADRFQIQAAGKILWGSGSAAQDVTLHRSATGTLAVTGNLTISGTVASTSTGWNTFAGSIATTGANSLQQASTSIIDHASGFRAIGYGANTSTPAGFSFIGLSSDGSVGGTRFSIDSSGNSTFAGSITVNSTPITLSASGTVQFVINSTNSGSKEIVFKNAGSVVGYVWNNSGYTAIGGGSEATSLFVTSATGNVGIGIYNPSYKLQVVGDAKITGSLTVDDGTESTATFGLKTYTKSLQIGTTWLDTGISGTDLATGSYIIQVYVNNYSVNGGQYFEAYTGVMSWYQLTTNSTEYDEIVLHKAGHAPSGNWINLRTLRQANPGTLKLQIISNVATNAATNYVFKFRRLV